MEVPQQPRPKGFRMDFSSTPVLKALVGSDTGLFTIDVIEFEGGLWLVTEWIDKKALGWTTPARIIRLDTIPHQVAQSGLNGANFVVNVSIPTAILHGADPTTVKTEHPLEIRDLPEIRFSSVVH